HREAAQAVGLEPFAAEGGGEVVERCVIESCHGGCLRQRRPTPPLSEQGIAIFSDALLSSEGFDDEFIHEVINHAETHVRGRVHTNGLENYGSLLKRAIKGTYVSVEPWHLFRYVDEQDCRFNARKQDDAARFVGVLHNVTGRRLAYAEVTGQNC
ncbi:MAG: transposase, partial [Armatimonadetes bacterium]|nr:transposase [Armatimonadota bacterium]